MGEDSHSFLASESKEDVALAALHALIYFEAQDRADAARRMEQVQYSSLTVLLAETLIADGDQYLSIDAVQAVLAARDQQLNREE